MPQSLEQHEQSVQSARWAVAAAHASLRFRGSQRDRRAGTGRRESSAGTPGDVRRAGQGSVVRVQVANTSTQPTAVVVGFTAADGKTHVVDSISTTTIRVVTGAEEIHVYVNPKYAIATGTPWIISLAPGATHGLTLPVDDFISTMNYARLDPGVVGGARLVFEARPAGKSSAPVWTGKVETKVGACPQ